MLRCLPACIASRGWLNGALTFDELCLQREDNVKAVHTPVMVVGDGTFAFSSSLRPPRSRLGSVQPDLGLSAAVVCVEEAHCGHQADLCILGRWLLCLGN